MMGLLHPCLELCCEEGRMSGGIGHAHQADRAPDLVSR